MQIQYSLTFRNFAVNLTLRNLIEASMNNLNLHASQVVVLDCLIAEDGLSQAELAARLKLSAPTVNRMIKSLEKSKFVVSKKSKNDNRIQKVFLTKSAKSVYPAILKNWLETDQEFFSSLSDTEKLLFSHLLDKLNL